MDIEQLYNASAPVSIEAPHARFPAFTYQVEETGAVIQYIVKITGFFGLKTAYNVRCEGGWGYVVNKHLKVKRWGS